MLGISPDPVGKLASFADAEGLTFPLLSDGDHAVAEAYAAWGEKKNYGRTYEGLIRSTVVVDPDGKVAVAQYNVRATGHVAKLRRDLKLDGRLTTSARHLPQGPADVTVQWRLASAVVGFPVLTAARSAPGGAGREW